MVKHTDHWLKNDFKYRKAERPPIRSNKERKGIIATIRELLDWERW